ncbi:MAG: glycosidase [Epulopiscium sp. Nuni2H_MBin001]|nr:MAG: glycosidase [Epulopiscium sp. Nuni2H_MBin001]
MGTISNQPMLNAYPDSIGGNLASAVNFLQEHNQLFSSFYILPSVFNSDLDRGFSVKDYNLNSDLATKEDLENLRNLGMELKLDFVLNHASVLSPQFQDLVENGEHSKYKDFFINWNTFWEGNGTMTEEGYIQPNPVLIKDMFFRKPGLPILMVTMPDNKRVPYWNTFYHEVSEENGKYSYLGQMDMNIKSPLVWEFYEETLQKIASYGSQIVRLDAFAYAPKQIGEKNFLNEPGTWELLKRVEQLASKHNLTLLPEIHAAYDTNIYEKISKQGYLTYDFFLPGIIIEAIENHNSKYLVKWAGELVSKGIKTVNMLGCHDGIPVLDLKGMLSDDEIDSVINTIVSRGGLVKNLHGQKNMYYQVNATYYSALGEDDAKMLLARALQLFMPGKPQIWYLDLFMGTNDYEAVTGDSGHKEINRTNLTLADIESKVCSNDAVKKQLEMIKFRNNYPAFGFDSKFEVSTEQDTIILSWEKDCHKAVLKANLRTYDFIINSI